jgi:hypothetical protein
MQGSSSYCSYPGLATKLAGTATERAFPCSLVVVLGRGSSTGERAGGMSQSGAWWREYNRRAGWLACGLACWLAFVACVIRGKGWQGSYSSSSASSSSIGPRHPGIDLVESRSCCFPFAERRDFKAVRRKRSGRRRKRRKPLSLSSLGLALVPCHAPTKAKRGWNKKRERAAVEQEGGGRGGGGGGGKDLIYSSSSLLCSSDQTWSGQMRACA